MICLNPPLYSLDPIIANDQSLALMNRSFLPRSGSKPPAGKALFSICSFKTKTYFISFFLLESLHLTQRVHVNLTFALQECLGALYVVSENGSKSVPYCGHNYQGVSDLVHYLPPKQNLRFNAMEETENYSVYRD